MQYRTKDGDVLDAICWVHYGHQTDAVEAVLLANPGLAETGPVFTAGILINLPDLPEPSPFLETVRLWD